jgi:outer membrane lipoprotein LolB
MKVTLMPYCWIVLAFFLTACSTLPVQKEDAYSRKVSQHLYDLVQWSLAGRMALTGINDSWSADINWEHLPEAEEIKLSGPLGQGAVVIHLSEGFVTVARGDDVAQFSTQPEEFINQQLGLSVPVRSLRYWVVGLPMPGQAFEDVAGGFKQAGWQIDYQQMQPVSGQSMPRKITVKNDKVKLKLFIDQWNLF